MPSTRTISAGPERYARGDRPDEHDRPPNVTGPASAHRITAASRKSPTRRRSSAANSSAVKATDCSTTGRLRVADPEAPAPWPRARGSAVMLPSTSRLEPLAVKKASEDSFVHGAGRSQLGPGGSSPGQSSASTATASVCVGCSRTPPSLTGQRASNVRGSSPKGTSLRTRHVGEASTGVILGVAPGEGESSRACWVARGAPVRAGSSQAPRSRQVKVSSDHGARPASRPGRPAHAAIVTEPDVRLALVRSGGLVGTVRRTCCGRSASPGRRR